MPVLQQKSSDNKFVRALRSYAYENAESAPMDMIAPASVVSPSVKYVLKGAVEGQKGKLERVLVKILDDGRAFMMKHGEPLSGVQLKGKKIPTDPEKLLKMFTSESGETPFEIVSSETTRKLQ